MVSALRGPGCALAPLSSCARARYVYRKKNEVAVVEEVAAAEAPAAAPAAAEETTIVVNNERLDVAGELNLGAWTRTRARDGRPGAC